MNLSATKPIYNITPFTLLDYPDKTACILWFAGCNMRCVYCYNPDIVFGKGKITFEQTLRFLKTRKNLLDGVVLSGGECTSHKHIRDLLIEIKKIGLSVKIDTNGSNPKIIKQLIQENLVDYIALDFKATKNKFNAITKSDLRNEFFEVLTHLTEKQLPFEVRTTIHSELLTNEDVAEMTKELEDRNYTGTYYLQYFRNDTETIGKINNSKSSYINLQNLNSKIHTVIRNES